MIRADRKSLAEAAKRVLPAAGGHMAVLSGMHVRAHDEHVELTCSNLDLTIAHSVIAWSQTPGAVAVPPARLLADFLANASGEVVEMKQEGDDLIVGCGDALVTMRCYDAEHWPDVKPSIGTSSALDAGQVDLLRRVTAYASRNPKRDERLRGVHLDDGVAVATDEYRLAYAELGHPFTGVLLPAATVTALAKEADGGMVLTADETGHQVTAIVDDTVWTHRTIAAKFPARQLWQKMAEKEAQAQLTLARARLAEAVRLGALTGSDVRHVILTTEGGKCRVVGRGDTDEVVDLVPCDGELPWPVTFSAKHLTDLCDMALEDEILMEFASDRAPLRVVTEPLTQVVMPVWPGVT